MRFLHALPHSLASLLCRPVVFPLAGVLAVAVLMLMPVQEGFSLADARLPQVAIAACLGGLLLLLLRRRALTLTAPDLMLALWAAYVVLRAWATPAVPCFPAVARALSLLSLYVGLRMLYSSARLSPCLTEGVLMLCVCLECLLCVWQLLTGSSRHAAFPVTGTFLNPGPCSALFLVGACLGVSRCFLPIPSDGSSLARLLRPLAVLTLVLCFLLLPLGWSRAALAAGLCCLLTALWPRMTGRSRLLAVTGLLVVGLFLYFVKRGSADGRLLFWAVSSRAFAVHPLTGSGMGSFFLAYSDATASSHASMPAALSAHADAIEYALADVVRVAVEQGVVGLALSISSVFIVLYRLRRRSVPLAVSLLGLLLFSLCSYPFQLLPFQLCFVLLAATAATPRRLPLVREPEGAGGRMAVPVTVCVLAVTLALLPLSRVRRSVCAARESQWVVGRNSTRLLGEYDRLAPLMQHDARFLFRYGQMLAAAGRYNESNRVLWQGTLVSNDPMLHVLRGHNYRHLRAYSQARRAYLRAHAQSPSRRYPLYCLMLLYRDCGHQASAARVARTLLAMPLGDTSPLARQISGEARRCILEQ